MNQLQTKQPAKTLFETVTEHRGRSLEEQQFRHNQATGHNRAGKLQVREEETSLNRAKIIVFQECLDCQDDNAKRPGQSLVELQAMSKVELIVQAKYIGARGHKQMTKIALIESIIDKYENTAIIDNP